MTLKYGSQGDDVKKLQEALNKSGYGLNVDGIYGAKTQEAVRKYQQSNGLAVDGITGNQTWSKLFGSSSGSSGTKKPSTQTTPMGTEYDPSKLTGAQADLNAIEGSMPQYKPSQEYTDALEALKQHQSAKPDAYVSPFSERLNALYEKVMGRGDFKYDFNADALYHQYRDRYAQEGQRAMQDSMASAAALTGGYGNSYAASAGQQAYNQYMQAANDIIPELEQRAFERWQAEGDEVLGELALLRDMDATEYGRHQDAQNEYYAMLEYLTGVAGEQYDRDYAQHQDALNMFLQNRDYYASKAAQESARRGSSAGGSGSSGTKKNASVESDVLANIGTTAGNVASGIMGAMGAFGGALKDFLSGNSTNSTNDNAATSPNTTLEKLTVAEADKYLEEIYKKEGLVAAAKEKSWLLQNGYIDFE